MAYSQTIFFFRGAGVVAWIKLNPITYIFTGAAQQVYNSVMSSYKYRFSRLCRLYLRNIF